MNTCKGDAIMTFAEELKRTRQRTFLSQGAFAKEVNVSFSTVNRWESGKTKPNLIAMKNIKEFCEKNKNGKKIKYIINRKQSSINKLSKSGQYAAKKREHEKSSVRCKVEHVFAVVKRLFGYRKTRYRGLRKQMLKSYIIFALANLYLADRKSLSV